MTDFLTEKHNEIKARMNELKPLVDEAARLEKALTALDGIPMNDIALADPTVTTVASGSIDKDDLVTKKTARKRPSRARSGAKRGRPKGTGTRGAQAVKIITENPGLTARQIAAKMGIKQNYLYRLLPGIPELRQNEETKGWHLREES